MCTTEEVNLFYARVLCVCQRVRVCVHLRMHDQACFECVCAHVHMGVFGTCVCKVRGCAWVCDQTQAMLSKAAYCTSQIPSVFVCVALLSIPETFEHAAAVVDALRKAIKRPVFWPICVCMAPPSIRPASDQAVPQCWSEFHV